MRAAGANELSSHRLDDIITLHSLFRSEGGSGGAARERSHLWRNKVAVGARVLLHIWTDGSSRRLVPSIDYLTHSVA